MLAFAKRCFAFVMCLNFSLSSGNTEIKLDIHSQCADSAELGWTLIIANNTIKFLSNCSLVSKYSSSSKPVLYHRFPFLPRQGVYKLEDKLFAGGKYLFSIRCADTVSNTVTVIASDNCPVVNSTHGPDVVYQEQTGLFSGTKDSVLGIVIGLLGVLIIIVTSFYLLRRYRMRQRRLRIRSYLGASLIDPFTSMQNRMDEIEANGGQRLMESSDSL